MQLAAQFGAGIVGALCLLGGSLAANFVVEQRSVWLAHLLGALLLILAVARVRPVVVLPWLVAGLALLALLASAPRRSDKLFELGVEGPVEAPPSQRRGLPQANILQPLWELRQAVAAPPPRHWSVSLPNPMLFGKGNTVRLVLPALGVESGAWLSELGLAGATGELVLEIEPVDVDGAFNIRPPRRTVRLDQDRRLPTEFFAEPVKPYSHPLRIELHAGPDLLGWYQETIKVRRGPRKLLAAAVGAAGAAGGLIAVYEFVRGFG